jgi:hypothetical protein
MAFYYIAAPGYSLSHRFAEYYGHEWHEAWVPGSCRLPSNHVPADRGGHGRLNGKHGAGGHTALYLGSSPAAKIEDFRYTLLLSELSVILAATLALRLVRRYRGSTC